MSMGWVPSLEAKSYNLLGYLFFENNKTREAVSVRKK